MYLVDSLLDIVSIAGCDVCVKRLVLGWQRTAILVPYFTLLHRPLASDDDSCTRLHTLPHTHQQLTLHAI